MRDKLGEAIKQQAWAEHRRNDSAREGGAPSGGQEPEPMPRLVQWLGGAVSLALVVGAVYWVFELGRRDATEVPIVRAMIGDARELPENSGGPEVDNQGLQVNEVLASDATAPVEPETTLAPPPQRVVPEDVTPPETRQAPPVLVPVETAAQAPSDPPEEATTPAPLPPSVQGADPDMARPPRRAAAAVISPNADRLSEAIADAIEQANSESAAPESATAPAAAPPPSSFAGEFMIQLGAYDDEESANRDYDLLLADNQDLLGRLERYVERREAGRRVFYRLRARGFANKDEATAMCTALLARSVQCIEVEAK